MCLFGWSFIEQSIDFTAPASSRRRQPLRWGGREIIRPGGSVDILAKLSDVDLYFWPMAPHGSAYSITFAARTKDANLNIAHATSFLPFQLAFWLPPSRRTTAGAEALLQVQLLGRPLHPRLVSKGTGTLDASRRTPWPVSKYRPCWPRHPARLEPRFERPPRRRQDPDAARVGERGSAFPSRRDYLAGSSPL
jgi:hypothetical protein